MPEKFLSNIMAMCCGLSLAVALGWNVTAGAADWRRLAEDLCIVLPTDTNLVDPICQIAVTRITNQSRYLPLLVP